MKFKADIGIIGAMTAEVEELISHLSKHRVETYSGIDFHLGVMLGKRVVVARSGIGKVFAAICAEAMLLNYSPALLVNSGVGGAISTQLRPCDIVFADRLVQHDMDTSPLGDPKGLVSGINKIYFDTDERAVNILSATAAELGVRSVVGVIATGDRFVCDLAEKQRLAADFGAAACEMEGGAIAHVAFVNATPCVVIRAISDSADGSANMEYAQFLPAAARISTSLTLALIEKY